MAGPVSIEVASRLDGSCIFDSKLHGRLPKKWLTFAALVATQLSHASASTPPFHQGWVGDLFRLVEPPASFSADAQEAPNWFRGHQALLHTWPHDASSPPWPGKVRAAYRLAGLLPYGRQDMGVGILYDQLIVTGGFCAGMEFGACAARGFITETWAMNVSESLQERPKRWTALADFPGEGRMGTACIIARDYPVSTAIVGAETSDRLERLFCWGGYNYTPLAADALPEAFKAIKSGGKSFNDGYSLGPDHAKDIAFPERWMWRREVDMPYRSGSSGIAYDSVNSRVYLFGGCSFDGLHNCDADHIGEHKHLGALLHVLDLKRTGAGWKPLPACPGTPRGYPAFAFTEANQLYTIGGFTTPSRGGDLFTVIDNWRFDIETSSWHWLPDSPFVSSDGFSRPSPLWHGRYMLLLGGAYRKKLMCSPPLYSAMEAGEATHLTQSTNDKDVFSAAAFYFDTHNHVFGSLDTLPISNSIPMTAVKGDIVFVLGGETPPLFGTLNTHTNMVLAMLLTNASTKALVDTDEYLRTFTQPIDPADNHAVILPDAINPFTGKPSSGHLERYYLDGNVYRACTTASVGANASACVGPQVPLCQRRALANHSRHKSFLQVRPHHSRESAGDRLSQTP